MVKEIDPTAWQRIYEVALGAAQGDERTALAMLQGCYVEMSSRLVVSEQPSDSWLDAMAAFCRTAADRLRDAATFYASGAQAGDARRASYLGTLHGAQAEAARFAGFLRERFETFELTSTPADADRLPDDGRDLEPLTEHA